MSRPLNLVQLYKEEVDGYEIQAVIRRMSGPDKQRIFHLDVIIRKGDSERYMQPCQLSTAMWQERPDAAKEMLRGIVIGIFKDRLNGK